MDLSISSKGLTELAKALRLAPMDARLATLLATKQAEALLVRRVRANLQGPPRWGHRGRSRVYPQSLTVSGARGGGGSGGHPGKFSGDMIRGVGGKKKPLVTGPNVFGGVGVGKPINNLKKGNLERRFPFFAPAVNASEAEIIAIYTAAWLAALSKL